jgi:Na+/proline symporter
LKVGTQTIRAVLAAGFAAGTLDIVAAFVIYGWLGVGPVRILQSISAGLLGAEAARGGETTAALGLFLQFFIATVAAWVYFIGSLRWPTLTERPIAWGTAYGVVVYVVMNFVVVPLSAVPKRPFNWRLAPLILLVHVVCVGIPIATVLRRDRSLAR